MKVIEILREHTWEGAGKSTHSDGDLPGDIIKVSRVRCTRCNLRLDIHFSNFSNWWICYSNDGIFIEIDPKGVIGRDILNCRIRVMGIALR